MIVGKSPMARWMQFSWPCYGLLDLAGRDQLSLRFDSSQYATMRSTAIAMNF